MDDPTIKFEPLLHPCNKVSPLLFNSDNQAVLYDRRTKPYQWVILDLRMIKTHERLLGRLILLENGELWMIEKEKLQQVHVNFRIVDFVYLRSSKVYLLGENNEFFIYDVTSKQATMIRRDVVSYVGNSKFQIMNTTQGVYLDSPSESIRLNIPEVKRYIDYREFSLLVTVTDQLFLICSKGENGMFIPWEEIEKCPPHDVDSHRTMYELTNVTDVRNIHHAIIRIFFARGGLKSGLMYLSGNRLEYCYIDEDDNTLRQGFYPDEIFQDITAIRDHCYVRDFEGRIYKCLTFPKLQLYQCDEPLFFHRVRMDRMKASRA